MPAFERAQLTTEMTILPAEGQDAQAPLDAAREAAGETGLAREAGPETIVLAGDRGEVLEAATRVVDAALDAGARGTRLEIEAQGDAPRFG